MKVLSLISVALANVVARSEESIELKDDCEKTVQCGGHMAHSCQECPLQFGKWYGQSWCNGDCYWWGTSCHEHYGPEINPKDIVAPNEESVELKDGCEKTVQCGGHMARSCQECPLDTEGGEWNGESWCNGDCWWSENKCHEKTVQCGGHMARSCQECPLDTEGGEWNGESWCNGDCWWSENKCHETYDDDIETSQFLRGKKEEIN